MKVTITAALMVLMVAPATATTMNFDFGRTDRQTSPPPNVPAWNNIVPATTDLFALFDIDGNIVPGASLSITDTFFQTGEPSQLGSESPSGDAAGFPTDATDDYFFGHVTAFAGADPNPYGEVTLRGLDPSTPYNFTFFSARNGVNDNRETRATATGANSSTGLMNTSNNDDEVLVLGGILPNSAGEIAVGFEGGPSNNNGVGFFYINLMSVTTIPEPAAASLVLIGLLSATARRHRA